MKWTTATGLIVLAGAAAMAGKVAFTPRDVSPHQVLNDVKARMTQPGYDERAALRDLERALEDARAADNAKLAVRLLLVHSQILRDLGAYADARADLERVLAVYQPGNRSLACQVAELQLLEGQLDEALSRVKRLLRRVPDSGEAWRLRGLLEVRMAEEQVVLAEDIARMALVSEEAERATALLRDLASRSLRDPARVALAHELRELFVPRREDRLEEVLNTVDEASKIYAEARASYAQSFADGIEPASVQAFVELLESAGHGDLAADFGLCASNFQEVAYDDLFTASLLDVLSRQGREEEVSKVLTAWPWDDLPADATFYEAACMALYEARQWREMADPINQLRRVGGERERSLGSFLVGVSNLELGRYEKAIEWLNRYLTDDPVEVVPNSVGIAWLGQARAYRALRKPKERQILEGAVAEAPDIDGDVWLRLVELMVQAPNAGYRIPEERWTKGMSLLPARTHELVDTWAELGEKSLAAAGHDFDVLYDKMRRQSTSLPTVDVGPYTMYRIARRHLQRGREKGAQKVAERLLRRYPNLVPAMDVIIESFLARNQTSLAADRLLERIRLTGRDHQAAAYIRRLGAEPFTSHQRMEAIRIDPTGTGRLATAAHLLGSGEPQRALRALELTRNIEDKPEIRMLLAETLIALGRFDEADQHLNTLLEDEVLGARALAALVRARLGSRDAQGVEALVERLRTTEGVAPELVLQVVDSLIANRKPALAQVLLDQLDSERSTRGGEVYRRMALAWAVSRAEDEQEQHRNDRAAQTALDRAEAFVADGSIEVTRLLFAIEDHDWTALPALVQDVRDSDFRATPLQAAIFACLGEQLAEAEQLARQGLSKAPHSAEWGIVLAVAQVLKNETPELPEFFGAKARGETLTFLRGSSDQKRDPRLVLGYLLAFDLPGWAAWATPRILRLQRTQARAGTLWPTYLSARALAAAGHREAARRSLELLTRINPDFGPAWDMLEHNIEAELDGDRFHPELVALRAQRFEALGPKLAGSRHRIAVDRAAQLFVDGKTDAAQAKLTEAFNEDETDASYGRELLARIFAAKDPARALVHYKRALEGLRPASDHELVAEFLAMLEEAMQRRNRGGSELREELVRRTLTQMQQMFPDDPLVALANVRMQVAEDSRNPDLAVGRVSRALDEFRTRTGGRPLESLRHGSATAWVDYLLTLAPDLAEALVRTDLAATPGDLDLWLLLARTRGERGHRDEALDMYRSLVAMSNDPRAHYGVAWMLAERGGAQGAIETHLRTADEATAGGEISARSTFVRVRGELLDSKPNHEGIIDALEKLWRRRRILGSDVPPLDLGRVYTRALMERRAPVDLERLATLGEEFSRQAQDHPYVEDLARALAGLASQLEPRDPAELEAMKANARKTRKRPNDKKRPANPKAGERAAKKPTGKNPEPRAGKAEPEGAPGPENAGEGGGEKPAAPGAEGGDQDPAASDAEGGDQDPAADGDVPQPAAGDGAAATEAERREPEPVRDGSGDGP